jgi:amino acid adenylation domain-containing protein/non-ribosomal peptide synthase protein (TIGR01720 family)
MQDVIQGFRLSPQQKRLWLMQRESSAFQARCLVRVEGQLDLEVFRESVQGLINRHEVLRTLFHCPTDLTFPIQMVAETSLPVWHVEDLTEQDSQDQDARIEELLFEEANHPFDLEQGPLLRLNILRLSVERWAIIFALPSLCADSSTIKNMVQDLGRCYQASLHGRDDLAQPTQYVQFSEWQNELQEEDDEAGKEYWRQRYASASPGLTLPYEKRTASQNEFQPASLGLDFAPDVTEKLIAVSGADSAEMSGFLLACWQILLWRLTAQANIIVAVEFDGRKYEELHEALGLFAKCLPVQQEFETDPPFSEIVRSVSESCRDAFAWQEYFNWEECFQPAPGKSDQNSFPVHFSFKEWPDGEQSGDLQFSCTQYYSCIEPYKLKLTCLRAGDSLSAELHFDSSSFWQEHVQLIARCFATLVRSVLMNPELRANDFEILSERDAQQLLTLAQPPASGCPPQKCIQELFEEQAARNHEAEAVVYNGQQLTYAQLNARANKLAHYLRQHGVGPNIIVGLCLNRSLDMVVGLLGVLKAGGAYLPLDPEHPPARLGFQLSESQSPVLITQQALSVLFPEFVGEVVCLDRDRERLESECEENPALEASPTDLAYLIFTSGSTGKPKGVEITHRNLVNYSWFMSRTLGLDGATSERLQFANVSTLSADLGNTPIFLSLISGGCLHILDYEIATDGDKFADYLIRQSIDVLKIVPSHLNALLPSLKIRNVFPPKYAILGGEALSFDLVRRISEISGNCRIINHYGPTETTIGSVIYPVDPAHAGEAWAVSVPIGRPIANMEIHILDERRRPIPLGLTGELYIGGVGLAQGYLNQPEQTQERFIQNPFSADPQARLYRTGDLARYLPDGNVEFCGRMDHQVKMRGYRIELGEIENALREHTNIREAIVQAREDQHGHKHLVAYCVPQHEPAPISLELVNALKQKLPAYMIPQIFINLKTLPLTKNGKVARQALPEPHFGLAAAERTLPRTDGEKKLAAIWTEVLGVADVGVHDNFFELGGDSVLSIQIISQARQAGLAIGPKQVFDYPTIAALAEAAATSTSLVLDQGLVSGPVPLLPIQRWFFERNLPDPHHYNQALLLEVKQALEFSALEKVVRQLLLHHDALRLRFTLEESGWQQVNVAPGVHLPFAYRDLSGTPESQQAAAIESEAAKFQVGFDLSSGPLAQVVYFDLGTNRPGRLLLIFHHLVVDGVSWRILLEDFQLACQQVIQGEEIKLPAKTTSFKVWAERLASYAQSADLQQEASYWLAAERQSVRPLPVDATEGHNSLAAARSFRVKLKAEETRALLHEVPAAYHTQINDVLLTALAQALTAWSGDRSLLVDLEGHGREPLFDDVDLTRTVGWFTTHFPVLLNLEPAMTPGEALRSVKEQWRQVPHRGIGYGVLRYLTGEAGLAERLRSLPHPDVSFNYLGQLDNVLPETASFTLANESVAQTQSLRGNQSHLLRVNAGVTEGQLQVVWTYSQDLYRQTTIEKLADRFQKALLALITDCRSSKKHSYEPSDFPDSELSQKELDLIVAKLNGAAGQALTPAHNLEDIYPLSPMQEGMLFQSLYDQNADAYFRQMSFAIHGKLNFPAFEQAWQRVIERHPLLRTCFFWEGVDKPVQVVQRKIPLPLEVYDWRDFTIGARQERLQTYLQEEQSRKFELTQAPLMRLALIRLEDHVCQFVWSYHHIMIDGWSRALIYKEVLALYEAFCDARDTVLEPPRPYRDYISWLRSQDLANAGTFWRERLRGLVPLRPLGAQPDPGTSAGQTGLTEIRKRQFSSELTENLQATARRHHLTLSTLVQGAWALLLSTLSGESEVVFGTVVSGRSISLPGSESMVGPFLNTLPMRVQVSPTDSILAWLKKLQQQQLELREFEYTPLVEVQRWSNLPRGKALFETAVNYTNYHVDASLRRKHQTIEVRASNFVERVQYAVVLEVEPGPPFTLSLLYNNRRFDEESIAVMLRQLESVLLKMTAGGEGNLEELLIAAQTGVISPRNKNFGSEPRLRHLLEARTVATPSEKSSAHSHLADLQSGERVQLSRRDAKEDYALSYHQERLWFIDQFERGSVYESSPTYHNLPLILHLSGPIDCELLESSLNTIIDRHEALRTRIITKNARTRQLVSPKETLRLRVVEAPEFMDQAQLIEMALEEARQPFILDQDQLVRAGLVRTNHGTSILIVTVHHIVADKRSLQLIAGELAEIYGARSEGRVPQLPEAALQYNQYSQWQLSFSEAEVDSLLSYWKWQLRGNLRALELPEDHPRAAIHTFTAATNRFSLGESLARRIEELCVQERSDPFTVVLAAFKALLHRYARQDEIIVGTSAPCRNQPGTENLVGPLANLLVLRSSLDRSLTFRAFLAQVTKSVQQAYANQDMPFDKLVLELKPEKDMSRTALFDVLFNFENEEPTELNCGSASARIIETNLGYGKYDLNLSLRREADGLSGVLVYNADIYDDFTITQMMRHFEVILDAVTSIPDRRIDDIVLLSDEEEHQQLVTWNSTQASYPADKTIHQLFELQAQRTPGKTAIVDGDTSLTYGELDQKANQLAHHLRTLGVAPDVLVAVCLDKSPEMIVALLAILKAGGAYLPLNPQFPEERLRFMIEDSRTTHLITAGGLGSVAEQIPSVIDLDKDRDCIFVQPVVPPLSNASPQNVAYCIYTSGSTGKPKGVLVEHRNVVRLMLNDKLPFTFTQADVWTMFHSYSFDFSVWEMYGALLYGGTLVLVSEDQMKDPLLFLNLLGAEKVTVLNQTPSAFYSLAGEALRHSETKLALRYVIFGGEELHAMQLREWKNVYPAVKLVNMYGITETTVHVTFKEVTDHEIEQNVSNIGRPIPTTTTYILDSDLRLLPIGVPGEVCVGGEGVGRGYLDRDDLSRQKFIRNPYKPEERMYRSGDLARFLPNGEMIYLARIDDQVQIRGFRVELGEVRSHLLEHPSVTKAEIIATHLHTGSLELVAYVELLAEVNATELRHHLGRTLPYYMVPSAFVMLKTLPLTSNGKVDRKALPPPDMARDLPPDVSESPLNLVEEVVAGIWAEVLEIERVNPGDNFLELGGHSLLATRVFSRIREAFQVELPLKTLFDAPTLKELASAIEKAMGTASEAVAPPLTPVARDRELPASFGQRGLWLINRLEPLSHLYNIPFALRLKGRLDTPALERCLAAVTERHESLRTTFSSANGQPIQVIGRSSNAELTKLDLREFPESDREAEAHRLAVEEAQKPFDLEHGPLLRTTLLQLGEEDHTLLFTMHHIISDGWSLEVLGREVAILYEAYSSGLAPTLPELPIQYADYAFWQHEYLRGERLDSQLDYWRHQLHGMQTLRLPLGSQKRRPARTDLGASEHLRLSGSLAVALRTLSRHEGVTAFITLLAAFKLLLYRYSGQEDLVVGSPMANRGRREVEGLIGYFVNTVPLRTDLSGNPTFRELLSRVRQTALSAYAHQDVPLEKLLKELHLDREADRIKPFLAVFVLQNAPMSPFKLRDVTISAVDIFKQTTPADLYFAATESSDGINASLKYSVDLFDGKMITGMLANFAGLLETVVANPECRLLEIPFREGSNASREAGQKGRNYRDDQFIF